MKIQVEVNNLIYDSSNRDCKCILSDSQGTVYAFLQVLDMGMPEHPLKKRYWGIYDHDDPEGAIQEIMERGGKWPLLPND